MCEAISEVMLILSCIFPYFEVDNFVMLAVLIYYILMSLHPISKATRLLNTCQNRENLVVLVVIATSTIATATDKS